MRERKIPHVRLKLVYKSWIGRPGEKNEGTFYFCCPKTSLDEWVEFYTKKLGHTLRRVDEFESKDAARMAPWDGYEDGTFVGRPS